MLKKDEKVDKKDRTNSWKRKTTELSSNIEVIKIFWLKYER